MLDLHLPAIREQPGVQGDYIPVAISDTGSGIEAGNMTQIFEPFTAKTVDKGTGLGLSRISGFSRQLSNALLKAAVWHRRKEQLGE